MGITQLWVIHRSQLVEVDQLFSYPHDFIHLRIFIAPFVCRQSTKQLVLDIQRTRRCGLPTQESSNSRRILGEVQACSVSQTILPGVPQGCFEDEVEEGSATAEWDAYLPGIQMPLTECMPRLTLTFQVSHDLDLGHSHNP